MGVRIVLIFAIIVVLGIGLYIYNSGMIGKEFKLLKALAPRYASSTPQVIKPVSEPAPPSAIAPTSTATTTTPSLPPGQSTSTASTTSATSTPTSSINPADIPQGFTASQISPYFRQVRFGGISAGSASYYGQISLYAYSVPAATTINVTGWQIKSNRGGEYIPQAVTLYDPSGLMPATDIRLASGDALYLYSSSAPVNLRLNKCIGYLPNRTQFNPQLPQNCPYFNRSEVQAFSGACQNYIMSLGSCESPNFANPRIPQNDFACRDYLNNHFTYRSCFDEHRADPDFLSREVRVWAGASPVDPFHDRALLMDQNGLLVDVYTY